VAIILKPKIIYVNSKEFYDLMSNSFKKFWGNSFYDKISLMPMFNHATKTYHLIESVNTDSQEITYQKVGYKLL